MFDRYKKLEYQINDLQKANDKFRDELYKLKNTFDSYYKFKVLYKSRLDWAFMFNNAPIYPLYYGDMSQAIPLFDPEVIEKYFFDKETAIEFVKDNLSNKDEPIILDLKTGKAVDFIQ